MGASRSLTLFDAPSITTLSMRKKKTKPNPNQLEQKYNNAIYVSSSIKQMAHKNEQFISDAHDVCMPARHSLSPNRVIYIAPVFNWQIHFHMSIHISDSFRILSAAIDMDTKSKS